MLSRLQYFSRTFRLKTAGRPHPNPARRALLLERTPSPRRGRTHALADAHLFLVGRKQDKHILHKVDHRGPWAMGIPRKEASRLYAGASNVLRTICVYAWYRISCEVPLIKHTWRRVASLSNVKLLVAGLFYTNSETDVLVTSSLVLDYTITTIPIQYKYTIPVVTKVVLHTFKGYTVQHMKRPECLADLTYPWHSWL